MNGSICGASSVVWKAKEHELDIIVAESLLTSAQLTAGKALVWLSVYLGDSC